MSAGFCAGITLNSAGNWSLVINETDVIGGPGGNFSPEYTSNTDSVTLDITDTLGSTDAWQVQVHKEDGPWSGALDLGLLRTGGGSGSGTITGGDSNFLTLTGIGQVFFEGAGDRTGVTVQMKLSGVSVILDAAVYSTTIYFTIVDIP